jgi:hypothetical protein
MPHYDPNDPLGTDFFGVEDMDNNLTPVSGRLMLAQAVARRWLTEPGELFYAPNYGYGIRRHLNAALEDTGSIASGLAAEAKKDERVDECSVDVTFLDEVLTINGRLVAATGPFDLVLSLSTTTLTLEVLDSP